VKQYLKNLNCIKVGEGERRFRCFEIVLNLWYIKKRPGPHRENRLCYPGNGTYVIPLNSELKANTSLFGSQKKTKILEKEKN
jgi:hypothetical protein